MSQHECRTRFVWADSSSMAWGKLLLAESDDSDISRMFGPHAFSRCDEAEAAGSGPWPGTTLYRVTRSSVLASASTPAPHGTDYAFVSSTPAWNRRWSRIDFDAHRNGVHNRLSAFPDAAEAIQRARWATEEDRSRYEGIVFRAYLLTWSVQAVEQSQP
ncbi:hypothetical protein [Streptomyces californicus]|uniref:hypothetical protein n=1 Tax=Streptomyces californicus TaxID=67351 RepID=UPI00296F1AEC|nr:hypothetical protein [Streptomyces californicus]MDW4912606.1 hypothetical protein [Streptomyces californicus]